MYVDPICRLMGPWASEITLPSIVLRILVSVILATIIGCERASKRHTAGLRTFVLVSLASTVAMLLDCYIAQTENHLFLLSVAAILSVAVISVNGILFSSRNQIKGLTTAAALWICAIIGLSAGAAFFTVTIVSFILLLFILSVMPMFEILLKNRSNHFEVHLELKSSQYLQEFITTCRKLGLLIDDVELNPAYANSGLSVYSVSLSIESAELKQYKAHKEIIEVLGTLDYVYHIEEMRS